MSFTLPGCAECLELGSTCIHRKRYRQAETFIKSNGVNVVDISAREPRLAWKGSYLNYIPGVLQSPDTYEIRICYSACQKYGWDMLTSVLIHEFGHAEAQKAGVKCEGEEAERKANELGCEKMPADLVPELYWPYREFFLRSYQTPGNWTEERFWDELAQWRGQHSSPS
jgi:hypothetical protein